MKESRRKNSVRLDQVKAAVINFIKSFFTKNLIIKIIALLFGLLIWGYTMMDQDPQRIKTVTDIRITFIGESDMISRKLIIRGDRTEILSNISARVSIPLTRYADLRGKDIEATVDLTSISEAGPQTIFINATTSEGTVLSVSPSYLVLEIDNLVTKRIPIEYRLTGTLPEGYWANTPVLSRKEIEITGAASDIENIVNGICYIDLSDRTSTYNEAMAITLFNAKGEEVIASVLYGQLASVSVEQSILKTKEVPIDVGSALLGMDSIPINYEIVEYKSIPATVTIAGSEAALEAVESLAVESVDVSGRTESLLTTVKISVPNGITLLNGDTVSIYVNIAEETEHLYLEQKSIRVHGLPEDTDLIVSLNVESVDVDIYGRISLMSLLDRSDVEVYVDVTDLGPGSSPYELKIMVELPSDEMQAELSWILSVETVRVSITGAIQEDLG